MTRGSTEAGVGRAGPDQAGAYVRYNDELETADPDEADTFAAIVAAMEKGGAITRERHGRAIRTSHAKAHGLLIGEFRVLDDLEPELRQGLFAEPRRYPAVVRLAHVPGELLDDRRVSTPRGLALKVLEVDGPKLPGHEGERSQDFVLDTGKAFIVSDARSFLAAITATELATPMPEAVKAAVSTASRAANAALNAVGLDSANLDFYGHPFLQPLGETYYSQCPMRYGDYVAKLAVRPDMPALADLARAKFEPGGENGLRDAVAAYFRTNPAEFAVGIQLCTDLERMPVENGGAEWPEADSPYRIVARLTLPAQEAFTPERQALIDEALSFCPSHSLAAHRPLGSIMRARMFAYRTLSRRRREANGLPSREIRSIDEVRAATPATAVDAAQTQPR